MLREWMEGIKEYVVRHKRWIADDGGRWHCCCMCNGPGEVVPFYGAKLSNALTSFGIYDFLVFFSMVRRQDDRLRFGFLHRMFRVRQ